MTTSNFFTQLQQQWEQQPQPAGTATGQWQALVNTGSRSPVTQMIRQVWAELIIGTLLTIPLLRALWQWPGGYAQGLALGITGLGLLSLAYYFRQLWLLRRLQRRSEPMRHHTAGHLQQLRSLLRLGHAANLGLTLVLAALALYGAAHYLLPSLPAAASRRFLLWFGLTVAASLALVHWLTKWHIRQAYGRQLDRLEAVLQELAAEEAGS